MRNVVRIWNINSNNILFLKRNDDGRLIVTVFPFSITITITPGSERKEIKFDEGIWNE